MAYWTSAFFLVIKKRIALVIGLLLLALAGWKFVDIVGWCWSQVSRRIRSFSVSSFPKAF